MIIHSRNTKVNITSLYSKITQLNSIRGIARMLFVKHLCLMRSGWFKVLDDCSTWNIYVLWITITPAWFQSG
ncbi:MAG: hypothetical protein LBI95_01950 [Holosporales bacterium]|nr:hypothetical protein [Holosporales bacterium]